MCHGVPAHRDARLPSYLVRVEVDDGAVVDAVFVVEQDWKTWYPALVEKPGEETTVCEARQLVLEAETALPAKQQCPPAPSFRPALSTRFSPFLPVLSGQEGVNRKRQAYLE